MLGLLLGYHNSEWTFSTLTTYLDRLCSLSAVEQVGNQFLCLKWNHILVYMSAGTCKRISVSGEISVSAAVGPSSAVYSFYVSLRKYKMSDPCGNGESSRVFAFGCGSGRWVYLRPVWLYTWSGSQEEQPAPSGSYSCLGSKKIAMQFVYGMF